MAWLTRWPEAGENQLFPGPSTSYDLRIWQGLWLRNEPSQALIRRFSDDKVGITWGKSGCIGRQVQWASQVLGTSILSRTRTLVSWFQTLCQAPDFGLNQNLLYCDDYRIVRRQYFAASDYLCRSKCFLRNSTDMGASLVKRASCYGLD